MLKVLLAFTLITAVGEGIMGTLFTPYVKDVLEGNAATLGTVNSAQAVGGILGGFVAAAAARRWTARVLFGWGAVVFGLIDLAIFCYPVLYVAAWPAVLGMALVGFPGAVCIAARTTLMQDHSTDAQRGRIFALLFGVSALSLTAGAVVAGFLGEAIGIIPILALQGGGYVVAGAMVLLLIGSTEAPDSTETPAVARDRGLVTTSALTSPPGPSTLIVGSPVPQRTMTARACSPPGLDSRCTAPAGTRRKSPGPPSTTSAPSGPDSIRMRPLTTYSVVSCSPWWCQPDTEPGSVSTTPVHMPASCIARLRAMPGVGSDGVSSSAPMRATGVAGSFVMRSSNRDSRVSASGPRLLRSDHPMPEEGHSWHRSSTPTCSSRTTPARR